MLTLKSWFNNNINKPFYGLVLLITLIQGLLFVIMLKKEQQKQDETIKYLSIITKQGINENNRKLIELIFMFGTNELKAQSIILCKNDKILIYQGRVNLKCNNKKKHESFFNRLVTYQLEGMPEYKIHYYIPRSFGSGQLNALLFLLFIFFSGSLFLILLVQIRLRRDIISPIIDAISGKSIENKKIGNYSGPLEQHG